MKLKKAIIYVLKILDPYNKITINLIHTILSTILFLPLLILEFSYMASLAKNPLVLFMLTTTLCINAYYIVVVILKLMIKEKVQSHEIKNSIPKFNIFHIFMFLLISLPFLAFIYAIVSGILEG